MMNSSNQQQYYNCSGNGRYMHVPGRHPRDAGRQNMGRGHVVGASECQRLNRYSSYENRALIGGFEMNRETHTNFCPQSSTNSWNVRPQNFQWRPNYQERDIRNYEMNRSRQCNFPGQPSRITGLNYVNVQSNRHCMGMPGTWQGGSHTDRRKPCLLDTGSSSFNQQGNCGQSQLAFWLMHTNKINGATSNILSPCQERSDTRNFRINKRKPNLNYSPKTVRPVTVNKFDPQITNKMATKDLSQQSSGLDKLARKESPYKQSSPTRDSDLAADSDKNNSQNTVLQIFDDLKISTSKSLKKSSANGEISEQHDSTLSSNRHISAQQDSTQSDNSEISVQDGTQSSNHEILAQQDSTRLDNLNISVQDSTQSPDREILAQQDSTQSANHAISAQQDCTQSDNLEILVQDSTQSSNLEISAQQDRTQSSNHEISAPQNSTQLDNHKILAQQDSMQSDNLEISVQDGTQSDNHEISAQQDGTQSANYVSSAQLDSTQAANCEISAQQDYGQLTNHETSAQQDNTQSANHEISAQQDSIQSANNEISAQQDSIQSANNEISAQQDSIQSANHEISAEQDNKQSTNQEILAQQDSTQLANHEILDQDSTQSANHEISAQQDSKKSTSKQEISAQQNSTGINTSTISPMHVENNKLSTISDLQVHSCESNDLKCESNDLDVQRNNNSEKHYEVASAVAPSGNGEELKSPRTPSFSDASQQGTSPVMTNRNQLPGSSKTPSRSLFARTSSPKVNRNLNTGKQWSSSDYFVSANVPMSSEKSPEKETTQTPVESGSKGSNSSVRSVTSPQHMDTDESENRESVDHHYKDTRTNNSKPRVIDYNHGSSPQGNRTRDWKGKPYYRDYSPQKHFSDYSPKYVSGDKYSREQPGLSPDPHRYRSHNDRYDQDLWQESRHGSYGCDDPWDKYDYSQRADRDRYEEYYREDNRTQGDRWNSERDYDVIDWERRNYDTEKYRKEQTGYRTNFDHRSDYRDSKYGHHYRSSSRERNYNHGSPCGSSHRNRYNDNSQAINEKRESIFRSKSAEERDLNRSSWRDQHNQQRSVSLVKEIRASSFTEGNISSQDTNTEASLRNEHRDKYSELTERQKGHGTPSKSDNGRGFKPTSAQDASYKTVRSGSVVRESNVATEKSNKPEAKLNDKPETPTRDSKSTNNLSKNIGKLDQPTEQQKGYGTPKKSDNVRGCRPTSAQDANYKTVRSGSIGRESSTAKEIPNKPEAKPSGKSETQTRDSNNSSANNSSNNTGKSLKSDQVDTWRVSTTPMANLYGDDPVERGDSYSSKHHHASILDSPYSSRSRHLSGTDSERHTGYSHSRNRHSSRGSVGSLGTTSHADRHGSLAKQKSRDNLPGGGQSCDGNSLPEIRSLGRKYSQLREDKSFRTIPFEEENSYEGSDLDIDLEDSDDELETPFFLTSLTEASSRPIPSTPTKNVSGIYTDSPVPGGSPQYSSIPTDHETTLFSLDSLLKDITEKSDKQRKYEEDHAELKAGIKRGGFIKDTLEKDNDPEVPGELLPEHQVTIQQFEVSKSVISDVHPGEEIFNSQRFQRLFTSSITPARCGFMPGTSLIDKHLSTLQPDCFMNLLTSDIMLMCFSKLSCPDAVLRWLLFIMSTHKSHLVLHGCLKIIEEHLHSQKYMGNKSKPTWSPAVSDVLSLLCNYGAEPSDFLPRMALFTDGDLFRDIPVMEARENNEMGGGYNRENLRLVLHTLAMAFQTRARYSGQELTQLLAILSRAALDKSLCNNMLTYEFQVVIASILKLYSESDWNSQSPSLCRMLSSLTSHHHNRMYLCHLLPPTTRGSYLQRRVSFCHLQHLFFPDRKIMDQHIQNFKLKLVHNMLPVLQGLSMTDVYKMTSAISLLDMCVGNGLIKSAEKDDIEYLTEQMKKITGDVRDNVQDLDRTRVKDMMIRVTSKWSLALLSVGSKQETLFSYTRRKSPPKITIEKVSASQSDNDDQSSQSEGEDNFITEEEENRNLVNSTLPNKISCLQQSTLSKFVTETNSLGSKELKVEKMDDSNIADRHKITNKDKENLFIEMNVDTSEEEMDLGQLDEEDDLPEL